MGVPSVDDNKAPGFVLFFSYTYRTATHIYPRVLTMAPSPFNIEEHDIDASYMREYPRGASSQYSPLKLAIKKYTPVDNLSPQPGDVTLIGAHGGGFSKVSACSFIGRPISRS